MYYKSYTTGFKVIFSMFILFPLLSYALSPSGLYSVGFLKSTHRLYAQVKNKEIIHCEACCCNVSYYGKAAHDKTKKHLSNLKYLNLLNSKNL